MAGLFLWQNSAHNPDIVLHMVKLTANYRYKLLGITISPAHDESFTLYHANRLSVRRIHSQEPPMKIINS